MPILDDARCPCLSGETYGACCGRFHRGGAVAPTAERLMRSRYSAFVTGDVDYLVRTWHPRTRPAELTLDTDIRWFRLDILSTTRGGMLDTEGIVEFDARYRDATGAGSQHETSRFVKERGAWYYVDAV